MNNPLFTYDSAMFEGLLFCHAMKSGFKKKDNAILTRCITIG